MKITEIQISADLAEAASKVEALLGKSKNIDKALHAKQVELEEARAFFEARQFDMGQLDAELSIQRETEPIRALERQIKGAAKSVEDAGAAAERVARVIKALKSRAATLDEEISVEEALFNISVNSANEVALKAAAEDLASAAAYLHAALRRAHAIDNALACRYLSEALAEVRIPTPGWACAAIIDGQSSTEGGLAINLASSWRDDPALVELNQRLRGPRELLTQLRTYKPFDERHREIAPYVRKG